MSRCSGSTAWRILVKAGPHLLIAAVIPTVSLWSDAIFGASPVPSVWRSDGTPLVRSPAGSGVATGAGCW